MIKFFRHIRRSLINENKIGKYFKYAIGEILLVVIGILIALQINNRNEAWKSTEVENKALLDLRKEFINNITQLNDICITRKGNDSILREYLNIITNETITNEDKSKHWIPGVYGAQWGAQSTVLSGIVNSGGLDNIKNESLKALLTQWPILVNRWEKREALLLPTIVEQRNYMATKIFRGIPKEEEIWNNDYPNYTQEKLQEQRKLVVNDLQFHNLTADIIGELWVQDFLCAELNKEYEKIMTVLDAEIYDRKLN